MIEKIRGSTNFLKSGTKPLHALMKNSQCWCVDDESTLVMRVGRLKYYRIELPYATEEDKAKVQQLKDVLKRILRFEATPCPFKRGFHVDLPESATTPHRKAPWKVKAGSLLSSPVSATTSPLSLRKYRAQISSDDIEIQFERRLSLADSRDGTEDGFSNSSGVEKRHIETQKEIVEDDCNGAVTDSGLSNSQQIPTSPSTSKSVEDGFPKQSSAALENSAITATLESSEDGEEAHDEEPSEALWPAENFNSTKAAQVTSDNTEFDNGAMTYLSPPSDQQISGSSPTPNSITDDVPNQSSPVLEFPVTTETLNFGGAEETHGEPSEAMRLAGDLKFAKAASVLSDGTDIDNSELEAASKTDNAFDGQLEVIAVSSISRENPAIALNHSMDTNDSLNMHLVKIIASGQPDVMDKVDEPQGNSVAGGIPDPAEAAEGNENGSKFANLSPSPEECMQLNLEARPHSAHEASAGQTTDELNIEPVVEVEPPRRSLQTPSYSPDAVSVSSRADSFHSLTSLQSVSSDIEASLAESPDPTSLAETFDSLKVSPLHHRRDASATCVTVDSKPTQETNVPVSPLRPYTATSEGQSTPSLLRSSASDSSWPSVETPAASSAEYCLRRRPKKKRSFSPLTPSSTLFPPSPQSPRRNYLTGAILQTARHLALVKPMEIFIMIAHILARIAGGATPSDLISGDLFRRPAGPHGEGRRRNSLPNQADFQRGDFSEEDDFGVPIRGRSRSAVPNIRRDDDADSLFDLD